MVCAQQANCVTSETDCMMVDGRDMLKCKVADAGYVVDADGFVSSAIPIGGIIAGVVVSLLSGIVIYMYRVWKKGNDQRIKPENDASEVSPRGMELRVPGQVRVCG